MRNRCPPRHRNRARNTAGVAACRRLGMRHQRNALASSTFECQGLLEDDGGPVTGPYDLLFTLYDAPTSGSRAGAPVESAAKHVANGLMTLTLDFGDVFDGTALWLEVGVRPESSSEGYETLSH